MKACVVLALFLVVALAAVAQGAEGKEEPQSIQHMDPVINLLERQVRASCALWECNSNCIRRGYRGGYCGVLGCQCY